MTIKLIAAVNYNNVIGNNNQIPWHNHADFKFFRKETIDHSVLMGRNTFNSLKQIPLIVRDNFVITRNITKQDRELENHFYNLKFFKTIEQVFNSYRMTEQVYIIGGAQIYQYALQHKIPDEVIISNITDHSSGDTVFNFNEAMANNYMFYNSETYKHKGDSCYVERFNRIWNLIVIVEEKRRLKKNG